MPLSYLTASMISIVLKYTLTSSETPHATKESGALEIPSYLESQIREGKVVLFLGAGASRDARDAAGCKAPSATELRDLLAGEFLGGKHKDLSLDQVGEYAISESDLVSVQEYLRKLFEPFQPTHAHHLMSSFRWAGLATTNYDRLIERSYENAGSVQEPVPF